MKKAFLFALAAFCAFAAQAVTVNWYSAQTATNNYTSTTAGVQLGLSEAGVTGAVSMSRVNFLVASSNDYVTNNTMTQFYAKVLSVGADNTVQTLMTGIAAQMYTNAGINSPSGAKVGSNQAFNGNGSYAYVSINLDGLEMDADTFYQILFYSDEACTTATTIKLRGYWESGVNPENAYILSNGDLNIHEEYVVKSLTWYEGESIPEPTPTVPEPTALALLALGVAGLALKRKVA